MTELDGATEAHLQLSLANAAHKPPWSSAISDPEWPPLKPALGSDWLPTLRAVFTLLQGDWREQSVVLSQPGHTPPLHCILLFLQGFHQASLSHCCLSSPHASHHPRLSSYPPLTGGWSRSHGMVVTWGHE